MTSNTKTLMAPVPRGNGAAGSTPWAWLALFPIAAAALALRAWGLASESFWWDEYTSLTHLDAPSLWEFLSRNRSLDPATLPLYYTLEYLFYHYCSDSYLALRWLSIALNLATIPLLFALGKTLYDARAGLLTATLFAVSPIHIFHGQGIRMYVLMILIAVLSAYSFLRVLQTNAPRWWLSHLAANLLLSWTHPFSCLLLVVEGLALLSQGWRTWRRTALWTLTNLLAILPAAVYLANVRFWPEETTRDWLQMPGLREFLADLFVDDAVQWTYQLRIPAHVVSKLGLILPVANAALLAVAITLALVALVRGPEFQARQVETLPVRRLLAFWVLVPPVLLLILSLVWRPCVLPRYTVHCGIAAYLLLAGGISSIRAGSWRVAAALALTALISLQTLFVRSAPMRTDWLSAARVIRENAVPEDDVVTVKTRIYWDVFRMNLGQTALPIATADTENFLALQSREYLCLPHAENTVGRPEAAVWAILANKYFDSRPNALFEKELAALGLAFDRQTIEGIEPILIYRITAAVPACENPLNLPKVVEDSFGYQHALTDLGLQLVLRQRLPQAREIFGKLQENKYWGPLYAPLADALTGGEAVERESRALQLYFDSFVTHSAESIPLLEASLEFNRNNVYALTELARLRVIAGDGDGAVAAIEHACEVDLNFVQEQRKTVQLAIEAAKRNDYRTAADLLELDLATGGFWVWVYRDLPEKLRSGDVSAQRLDAVNLILQGIGADDERALDLFRQALELDPDNLAATTELAKKLVEQKRFDEALPLLERACAVDKQFALLNGRLVTVLKANADPEKTLASVANVLEAIRELGAENFEKALLLGQEAIALDPDYGLPHYCMSLALLSLGRLQESATQLVLSTQRDAYTSMVLGPFVDALFVRKDRAAAAAEIRRLRDSAVELPESLLNLPSPEATAAAPAPD